MSWRDYYRSDCRNKLLHFFIPCSQELKVLRLEEARGGSWSTLNFKSDRELPSYFKSIVTPAGDIYLTGGSRGTPPYTQASKSSTRSIDTTSIRIPWSWLAR
jgi:hypothetical protein